MLAGISCMHKVHDDDVVGLSKSGRSSAGVRGQAGGAAARLKMIGMLAGTSCWQPVPVKHLL